MIYEFMDRYGYPDWPVKFRVGAQHTTAFGLDDTFRASGRPLRIHAATDRGTYLSDWKTRSFDVYCPFEAQRAQFVSSPGTGFGNILRLFIAGSDFEIRVMHMRRTDVDQWIMGLMEKGERIPSGTYLGKAGNAGISVGSAGGHHTHTEIVSFDKESKLLEKLTREKAKSMMDEDWGLEQVKRWSARQSLKGNLLEDYSKERKMRKVRLFNEYVCRRVDYLTGRLATFYDSALVFNGL
jgi:hypothetical protein